LVENTDGLIRKLGKKQLTLHLHDKLESIPDSLAAYGLEIGADGQELIFTYDTHAERTGITALMRDMGDAGVRFSDLNTTQSSLEDIFVDLVGSTK
jgi:ABC-2 type transport system ATP-binding protein